MNNDSIKEIINKLQNINNRGYSSYNVFSDWLDLMLYALMRDDENYLKIVRKYKNERKQGEREIDFFANAFSLLLAGMKKTNCDLLGEIYMQWNLNNKHSGQFFTPHHIAGLMAQLAKPNVCESINDPACGSGVMLIELCKIMTLKELNEAFFVGQDMDWDCVRMCALNMTFFNLNSYIIHGNTLKMEFNRVFQTARHICGGSIRELSQEEIKKRNTFKGLKNEAKQQVLFN